MRKLIDYIALTKYVPRVLNMLEKDKDGMYYVNMQKYGDAGFTWLDGYEFKLVQMTIRAITKQDKLTLDYRAALAYADATITDEDIVEMEGEFQYVIWSEKEQEYIDLH